MLETVVKIVTASKQKAKRVLAKNSPPGQEGQDRLVGPGWLISTSTSYICKSFLITLLLSSSALAQSTSLRGIVTADDDGLPLQGVNVVMRSSSDPFIGAVTDADGFYVISRVPAGVYRVQASFVGFQTFVDTLSFDEGVHLLNIALQTGSAELDEVLVETERVDTGARVSAGLQSIQPQDLELVPAPDITADLTSYLTTMPGIITTGDRGGQVFIRGGEPSHNLVLLDGMYVYQPFHILGFYSAFSADILQRADVYAGGYGSKHSGRASSVIDVQARNGNKREHEKSFSVSPFVNALRVEGPIFTERLSVLGSLRQSVIDRLASQYIDQELPYKFGDVFGKAHLNVTENQQLSVTALYTYDRGALDNAPALSRNEVRWSNTGIGARYLILPQNSPVLAEVLFSVSRLNTELGPRSAPTRTSEIESFNTAINVTNYAGRSSFSWGGYFRTTSLQTVLGGLYQNVDATNSRLPKIGFYLEPNIFLGNGVRVEPGLSMQFFDQEGFFFEPRLRFVVERGPHTFSGAGGLYHQEYVGLNDRRDATSVFTAWTDTPFDKLTRAKHAIVGYQRSLGDQIFISVEGYYKWLSDLYISEWTPFPRLTTQVQPADGTVKGIDARVEIKSPVFYGFVTYGISSVQYDTRQDAFELWFGDPEISFRPPHDRRHQLNALASARLGKYELSVRWNFGSGLPYNQVRGFDEFILLDGDVDVAAEEGSPRVIYDRPYGGVLPTYHRLDVTVDRTFPFKGGEFSLQAGVINVYDRSNLFALDLFTLEQTRQLPFIPTVGAKIEF